MEKELKLFIFADDWDHSQDSWTHPKMVVAEKVGDAIKVLIKNTWGATGDYSFGGRVQHGVPEVDILSVEIKQDSQQFRYRYDTYKVMEYEIKEGIFINSNP